MKINKSREASGVKSKGQGEIRNKNKTPDKQDKLDKPDKLEEEKKDE